MQEPTAERRIQWVDVAKAGAVVLVVLYHVAGVGLSLLLPPGEHATARGWKLIADALVPVRMPLFFLVSGLLAASAVHRPWRALWRKRVGNLLWPFVVWSVLYAPIAAFAYQPEDPAAYARGSLVAIPAGGTAYWYLSVLVIIFVAARALRRWWPALLVAAVVVHGVAPLVGPALEPFLGSSGAANAGRVAYFAVWFLVGCFGRPLVQALSTARARLLLPTAALSYLALSWLVYVHGTSLRLSTTMTLVGLVAGVMGSAALARADLVARLGRYLAARTLPIYVLHPMLLNLLIIAARGSVPPGWAVALVPVLTIGLTWAAAAIYDLCTKVGLRWLFAFPGGRGAESVPIATPRHRLERLSGAAARQP